MKGSHKTCCCGAAACAQPAQKSAHARARPVRRGLPFRIKRIARPSQTFNGRSHAQRRALRCGPRYRYSAREQQLPIPSERTAAAACRYCFALVRRRRRCWPQLYRWGCTGGGRRCNSAKKSVPLEGRGLVRSSLLFPTSRCIVSVFECESKIVAQI